jgi:hypothetical protein
MTGLLSVKRSRTRPRYEHGCQPNCGHKYAGHCPARQNVRPPTDTTKSRAGKRIVPLPGRSSTCCWLTKNFSQWNDGEPLNSGPKRAGFLQTRLVGPLIPEPTGTAEASTFNRWRPRRAPPRCASHRSHRSSAARRARAHDHERSGLVNDRDGDPLHARNHADPQ